MTAVYIAVWNSDFSTTIIHSIVQWGYVPDFLCELIISRDIVVRKLFLTDIPHISWEAVMLQMRY